MKGISPHDPDQEVIDKIVSDLAKSHLGIETLEVQHSDQLDFHDVSVVSLKDALTAAYKAGWLDA